MLAGDSLIAAIVGGFTILLGPVVGAVLYIYAQGEFAESGNLQLYTGLAMIIAVVFLPGGITGFGRCRCTARSAASSTAREASK